MWSIKIYQNFYRTLKHRRNCSNQVIREIAKVAFTGRASKKVERATIVVDPNGNCVGVHADSGINCGNPALAPDSMQIDNNEIKGDNPPLDIEC